MSNLELMVAQEIKPEYDAKTIVDKLLGDEEFCQVLDENPDLSKWEGDWLREFLYDLDKNMLKDEDEEDGDDDDDGDDEDEDE